MAWLESHHDAIARALDRFADHAEWAVKGTLDRTKAKACFLAAALARRGGAFSSSPGARYFEERRIQTAIDQDLNVWLKEVCAGIAKALLDRAVEFRERQLIQSINAEHAVDGLVLELSGPWPPYSFCPSLEPEAAQ